MRPFRFSIVASGRWEHSKAIEQLIQPRRHVSHSQIFCTVPNIGEPLERERHLDRLISLHLVKMKPSEQLLLHLLLRPSLPFRSSWHFTPFELSCMLSSWVFLSVKQRSSLTSFLVYVFRHSDGSYGVPYTLYEVEV